MNESGRCFEKEALVDYLYDELPFGDRQAVESHVAACGGCAQELAALQGVRGQLQAWTPPERAHGIRMVGDPPPAAPRWYLPGWALAAAAVLVLAASASVANLEIRYGSDGLVVRTGWSPRPEPVLPAPTAAATPPWRAELIALEERLRVGRAETVAESTGPAGSEAVDDLLPRLSALIAASERRQERELALRLVQLSRDLDVQRQSDLVRIEQGFGRIEGLTGAEVARQREILNYLVQVSQGR